MAMAAGLREAIDAMDLWEVVFNKFTNRTCFFIQAWYAAAGGAEPHRFSDGDRTAKGAARVLL